MEATVHAQRVRNAVEVMASEPEVSRNALTAFMHDGERRECLEAALEIIQNLRGALEWCVAEMFDHGLSDIDGGSFQDVMVDRGLLVTVPASDDIREQYDTEEMLVLAWKAPAQPTGGQC